MTAKKILYLFMILILIKYKNEIYNIFFCKIIYIFYSMFILQNSALIFLLFSLCVIITFL